MARFRTYLLIAIAALVTRPAQTQTAPEPAVRAVRFVPESQPIPAESLRALLAVQEGEPLDRLAVRTSLERLFATGRYRNLRAELSEQNGATVLTFITEPAWFVGQVTVSGVPDPPNQGQLVTACGLSLGDEFHEEDLPANAEGIRRLLERNGFYEARVVPRVAYEAATQQAIIEFRAETGSRARFTEPKIIGAPAEDQRTIVRATRWPRFMGGFGWKHVTESRVSRGLERIRQMYAKRENLLNQVHLEEMVYSKPARTAQPVVQVSPGPEIGIEVVGAKIGTGKLRTLVPLHQEQAADRDLLLEGMRNITANLQDQGYFRADVRLDSEQQPSGRQLVRYHVDTGERYKLTALDIQGNRYFDTPTLRERMAITPFTKVRYRNGRFSETLLRGDVAAIRNLYVSNGFRDVRIETQVTEEVAAQQKLLRVALRVDEGTQWLVERLDLVGMEPVLEETIRGLAASQEGQPFSEVSIAADRDEILNYYFNNGFPEASFEWAAEPGTQPHRAAVRYVIKQGPDRRVRQVLVSGLRTSNPGMVFDRIRLVPGEPLSQAKLIESQRRLYDLGVFARVDTALQNPEGNERDKYVLFQFEEARRYSVNFGLGAEIARIGGGVANFSAPAGEPGFSPRVSFGLSRSNFLGLGHIVSAQARFSNIQQRQLITYLAPQFKGVDGLTLTVSGFNDLSRDIRTFTGRRQEGAVQLGKRLSRSDTIQGRFAYRRNTIDPNSLAIDPALIPIYSQPVRVGIAGGSYIRDRRDDPIDSHRGTYNFVDVGWASKYFGSETDYVRLLGRNSTYHRLYKGKDIILARSTAVGWQYNLGLLGAVGIPLSERYYSGGPSSHRGFPENQAGPRDLTTGFPIGGSALLLNNVEVRFPLIGDSLGGVLFHDAGNVYSSFEDISFRVIQKDLTDFNYMVHAVGFGLRYRTPIGPIRVDFAYAPNSPRFYGFKGSQEDLIAGRGEQVEQRINRFQFHFSLGQTF